MLKAGVETVVEKLVPLHNANGQQLLTRQNLHMHCRLL